MARTCIVFAALLTIGAFMFQSISDASERIPIRFGTNWLAQAEHGGFYQAVADGDYVDCGLDVTIVPGGPHANNLSLLIDGELDFLASSNMLEVISAAANGDRIKVVAAMFQKEPGALITHPGRTASFRGIRKLDTLLIGDVGYQTYFQWLKKSYGFSSKNRAVYHFDQAPFLSNENSAQQAYVTSEPFVVETEGGFKPDVYLLADYGFSTYAMTIGAMTDYIDENPETVQCFVNGSIRGWYKYLHGDNSAANAMIKRDNPVNTDAQIAFSIEQMKAHGIVESGEAARFGIGAMAHWRHLDFYRKMVESDVAEDGLDITELYTLDFVNKRIGMELRQGVGDVVVSWR